ncbi:MAG: YtxH domain-containing protein [Caldicoprobacterales bacterium]|jgi:gas vesicle protein|nr:hypothetical protein [Clostridiales bacterium]
MKFISTGSFVIGGIIGALAGILLLPKINGDRRRFSSRAMEIVADGQDKLTVISKE